jgi:polyisoprenoid-binding protein YceI
MTRSRAAFAALAALALATAPALADTWKIDSSHSSVSFSVTHMMVSTVRGVAAAPSGTLEYDGKSPSSIKIDASVDANTISTNNEKRDGHLKTDDFFDVANNPTITFKSKKATAGTKPGTFTIVGDLTIRGTTKEVTFEGTGPSPVVKGMRGESRVGASVTGKINRPQVEPRARGRRGRREQRGQPHDRHRGHPAAARGAGRHTQAVTPETTP